MKLISLLVVLLLVELVLGKFTMQKVLNAAESTRKHASGWVSPFAGTCPFPDLPAVTKSRVPAIPWIDIAYARQTWGNTGVDARALAFMNAVPGSALVVRGDCPTTIVNVGIAGANCGMKLGSCGNTVGSIYYYAGCKVARRYPFESSTYIRHWLSLTGTTAVKKAAMREFVGAAAQNTHADLLQPGDWIWLPGHSQIFLKWADDNGGNTDGWALISHGPGWTSSGVRPMALTRNCLRAGKRCGNFDPLVRIMRPEIDPASTIHSGAAATTPATTTTPVSIPPPRPEEEAAQMSFPPDEFTPTPEEEAAQQSFPKEPLK